jgi:hypothetical protein
MEKLERVLSLRWSTMQFQSNGKDICLQKFLVVRRAAFHEELSGCFYGSCGYIWSAIPNSQPTGQIGRQKKISKAYNTRYKRSVSLSQATKAEPDSETASRDHKSWNI